MTAIEPPHIRYVGVLGPSDPANPEWLSYARAVGAELARRGIVVVNGGGAGVMAAASDGARSEGGIVVGLLKEPNRAGANPSLTVAVPTGMGEGRNALVVNSSDAVIAIGGNWGTLSELSLARAAGKPVACIDGWRVVRSDGTSADDELRRVAAVDPESTARDAVTTVLRSTTNPGDESGGPFPG